MSYSKYLSCPSSLNGLQQPDITQDAGAKVYNRPYMQCKQRHHEHWATTHGRWNNSVASSSAFLTTSLICLWNFSLESTRTPNSLNWNKLQKLAMDVIENYNSLKLLSLSLMATYLLKFKEIPRLSNRVHWI